MSKEPQKITKGRGAQKQLNNRYSQHSYEPDEEALDGVEDVPFPTEFQEVHPKTMLNRVDSPDIPLPWGMNPYQGCEHGCIYCYARPTHEYWGYNAGLDFERKIMVKKNAPQLLREKLASKSWSGETIMLSGNTDCYQPVERKMGITRHLLEICLEHKQSVGIITKNALVLRDIDILSEMARLKLVHVNLSITTRDETLRRILEPRTSSFKAKMNAVTRLVDASIPTSVMMAPIIPGLTDHEIMKMAKDASIAGAWSMNYTILRLGGPVLKLFEQWMDLHLPNRKEKVMNALKDCHGGSTFSTKFGDRMKGKGNTADIIGQQIKLAKEKFGLNKNIPTMRTDLFRQKPGQFQLF
jgi:DNA repair photolyase